jgi:hypothetical protein
LVNVELSRSNKFKFEARNPKFETISNVQNSNVSNKSFEF